MTINVLINGSVIPCVSSQQANILSYRSLNSTYPQYEGGFSFDGVNAPTYVFSNIVALHIRQLTKACNSAIADTNIQIQQAEEAGTSTSSLIQTRGTIRAIPSMDLSSYSTIADLYASVPSSISSYWAALATI